MESVDFVVLKCPNCGGKLEIYKDMAGFACGYCGSNILANRRGGAVTLSLDEATIAIQKNTDRTAAELALRRLPAELEQKERELEEKSTELQVRGYQLRSASNITGYEKKPIIDFFTVLGIILAWTMTIGVVAILMAVSMDMGKTLSLGQIAILVILAVAPWPIGFSIRQQINRKNAALNEQIEAKRIKAVQESTAYHQKRLDEAQAEYDEVSRQVSDLKERIARNRAIADA